MACGTRPRRLRRAPHCRQIVDCVPSWRRGPLPTRVRPAHPAPRLWPSVAAGPRVPGRNADGAFPLFRALSSAGRQTVPVPMSQRQGLRGARDWLGHQDSNLGMAESKSAALPLGYAPPSRRARPLSSEKLPRPQARPADKAASAAGRSLLGKTPLPGTTVAHSAVPWRATGAHSTSVMRVAPVSSMTSRSTPRAMPLAGGIAARAARKSASIGCRSP